MNLDGRACKNLKKGWYHYSIAKLSGASRASTNSLELRSTRTYHICIAATPVPLRATVFRDRWHAQLAESRLRSRARA
uniref:Uncharacterized protein n=1 Tax=Mycena chlorophos TaxID=658473 RepID=A0ABQ0LB90_MYCCL|nr:predicted protein [Mycena chlorophos]